jgi:hypothetical protein
MTPLIVDRVFPKPDATGTIGIEFSSLLLVLATSTSRNGLGKGRMLWSLFPFLEVCNNLVQFRSVAGACPIGERCSKSFDFITYFSSTLRSFGGLQEGHSAEFGA